MTFQRKVVIGICIGIVVLALAGAGTAVAYDVYTKRGEDPVARAFAPYLPVAHVGSRTISDAQFLDARDTIAVYLKSQAAIDAGLAGPLTPDVEKSALDRLVREAIDDELASQRNVSVSDEDTRAAFAELTASTSSSIPDVATYLKQTFNWNEQQFRDNVIKPSLLEQKLADTFVSGSSTTSTPQADPATLFDAYVAQRLAQPDVKEYLKFPGVTDTSDTMQAPDDGSASSDGSVVPDDGSGTDGTVNIPDTGTSTSP